MPNRHAQRRGENDTEQRDPKRVDEADEERAGVSVAARRYSRAAASDLEAGRAAQKVES